jgi:hypothetical protein
MALIENDAPPVDVEKVNVLLSWEILGKWQSQTSPLANFTRKLYKCGMPAADNTVCC